jgi:hypothetical protein
MKHWTWKPSDAVRGFVAGAEAVTALSAAHLLFEAGGKNVLPASLQRALRSVVEGEAARMFTGLTGAGLLEAGVSAATQVAPATTARVVAAQAVRAAGRQVLRRVGAAAGAGALIDGGLAFVHAVGCVRRGTMTRRQAVQHVAREATTGAAATVAGTAAGVLVVAATGGVAVPAVFLVGAATSLGAKVGLDAWLAARSGGAIRAELASQASSGAASVAEASGAASSAGG